MARAIARGFADPVFDGQRSFRAIMRALARPGTVTELVVDLDPPRPFTPEVAAVALSLCDHETPVWLDAALAAEGRVAEYLRFHTGASIASDPAEAAFALVAEPAACPPLGVFNQGSQDYPDRSTTLVMAVSGLTSRAGYVLEGPGIEVRAVLGIEPLPARFEEDARENHARFPRGVDLAFAAPGAIAALPRSTAIVGRR